MKYGYTYIRPESGITVIFVRPSIWAQLRGALLDVVGAAGSAVIVLSSLAGSIAALAIYRALVH